MTGPRGRRRFQTAGRRRDPSEALAAHGGAFPIIVRDVGVVGTVTVSGLPQEDDHRLVVETLRAVLADR